MRIYERKTWNSSRKSPWKISWLHSQERFLFILESLSSSERNFESFMKNHMMNCRKNSGRNIWNNSGKNPWKREWNRWKNTKRKSCGNSWMVPGGILVRIMEKSLEQFWEESKKKNQVGPLVELGNKVKESKSVENFGRMSELWKMLLEEFRDEYI